MMPVMAQKPPPPNLSGLTHEEKDLLIQKLLARLDALESKVRRPPVRCRPAVHQRPCRTVYQQCCRARRAHAESEAENIWLLPYGRRRRKLLRHPLLPRHASQARTRHARSATACLRRQSYPAHRVAAEQSQKKHNKCAFFHIAFF